MNDLIRNSLVFIGLVLLQVLILNNICFLGFINPYLYVYFILLLPTSTGRDLTLFLGFLIGLCVDLFCNTLGCHAFATTLMAYLKPYIHGILGPREDYDAYIPSFKTFGREPFLEYAAILVFIHHLTFFVIESFTLANILHSLWYALCCSLFTLLLIYCAERIKER